MLARIAIATITFGSAFCLAHFLPQAITVTEPAKSSIIAPQAPSSRAGQSRIPKS